MLGWEKHQLESRLPGEISITSDMQMTPPLWQKWRGTKKPLEESERGEWKSWLKTRHSENEDHGIWSHHLETVSDFILGGFKITADGDCSHEIKRRLLLGRKYFCHLMQRTDSFGKTLVLVVIKGRRRRRWQRMRWLDDITDLMDMNFSKLWEWWLTGKPGVL